MSEKVKYSLCAFCNQKIHIEEFAGIKNGKCFHKGCFVLNTKWEKLLTLLKEWINDKIDWADAQISSETQHSEDIIDELKEDVKTVFEDIKEVIPGEKLELKNEKGEKYGEIL